MKKNTFIVFSQVTVFRAPISMSDKVAAELNKHLQAQWEVQIAPKIKNIARRLGISVQLEEE